MGKLNYFAYKIFVNIDIFNIEIVKYMSNQATTYFTFYTNPICQKYT